MLSQLEQSALTENSHHQSELQTQGLSFNTQKPGIHGASREGASRERRSPGSPVPGWPAAPAFGKLSGSKGPFLSHLGDTHRAQ